MNDAPDDPLHLPAGTAEADGLADPILTGAGGATYRFPWPPPEDQPIVASLVQTWRDVMFHPSTFFRAMPQRAPLGSALLYYLVIGIIAAALRLFWDTLLPRSEGNLLNDMIGTMPVSPIVDFLVSPLLLLASLLVAAGITHLMVLTLVPGNAGAGATFRIFAFAYSPAILEAVPYLGAIAAFLWMTVLSAIGVREVHRTSTARAVTAVLVPILIAAVFMAASYLLLRSGLLLAAG